MYGYKYPYAIIISIYISLNKCTDVIVWIHTNYFDVRMLTKPLGVIFYIPGDVFLNTLFDMPSFDL